MIAERIKEIQGKLPAGVRLVAVSKFHPAEAVREAYEAGQRLFGENHVQELVSKHEELPKDIEWHFIGHLQTNKVKYIVPFVSLIHGIDTEKLLACVNKEAAKAGRVVRCLLQVHIAKEETKFGFTPDELRQFVKAGTWRELRNVQICGLMGMATNTNDDAQVRLEFHELSNLFHEVKENCFPHDDAFCELSMGMSDDYPLAIAEGSTLVRIGTYIFGERDYSKN